MLSSPTRRLNRAILLRPRAESITSKPGNRLYDEDFYLWTQQQAEALAALAAERWDGPLDLQNLAKAVSDLGKAEKRTVRRQLTQLVVQCLKLSHAPASAARDGWHDVLDQARDEVQGHMTPLMHETMETELPRLYGRARREVAHMLAGHGEAADLPAACPYTLDQLLTDDWYPMPVNRPAARP